METVRVEVPPWIQGLYGLDDLKNADEVIVTEGHGQTRMVDGVLVMRCDALNEMVETYPTFSANKDWM